MYELAKKARSGMKSKAERLAGEKDRKTDSSDWSPAPELNADVKTGMRPVSRRAYKKGGKVVGCATPTRADRKPRKAGGKVEAKSEQPMVDRYVNRDLKKANEYRDGKKHVGALKHGGRAKKANGGMTMEEMIAKNPAPKKEPEFKMPNPVPLPPRRKEDKPKFKSKYDLTTHGKKNGGAAKHSDVKEDKALIKKMVKPSAMKEGRAKKQDGGGMDPRLGIVSPKMLQFGANEVTPGLKKGGRAKKEVGGPAIEAGKAAMAAMSNRPPVGPNPSASNVPPVSSGLLPQPKGDYIKPPSYDPDKYKDAGKNAGKKGVSDFMDRVKNYGKMPGTAKDGGRIAKAKGGSFWGSKEFQSAFRDARKAFLAGEGPKNFEFKGKSYSTDLLKVPTPPERQRPVQEKKITVEFGPPKGQMPKTDQMGNPNPGMKKGGRVAKQIGGALGRAANAFGRNMASQFNQGMMGRGPAPQAMANAQGRPFQPGGKFATQPAPMQPQPMPMPNQFVGNTGQIRQQRPPEMTTMPLNPVPAPINYIDMGEYLGGTQNMTPTPARMPNPIVGGAQGMPRSIGTDPFGASMGVVSNRPSMQRPGNIGSPMAVTQPPSSIGGQVGPNLDENFYSGPITPDPYLPAVMPNPIVGGNYQPMPMPNPMARKNGGRVARTFGGETGHKSKGKSKSKSGKTHINIVIATGKDQQQQMPPAPMGGPMPPPPPPPAPPMGGPMAGPMGAPPMPPPAMGGGMPPMPPDMMGGAPMPRKAGGRVTKVAKSYKDMTAGAGSGEGRLQKTDIAKRAPHKAGGKVYRSYKDMDAGAGSGKGRMEKTEIQKRKK